MKPERPRLFGESSLDSFVRDYTRLGPFKTTTRLYDCYQRNWRPEQKAPKGPPKLVLTAVYNNLRLFFMVIRTDTTHMNDNCYDLNIKKKMLERGGIGWMVILKGRHADTRQMDSRPRRLLEECPIVSSFSACHALSSFYFLVSGFVSSQFKKKRPLAAQQETLLCQG